MSLAQVYEKYFGEKVAAEKAADETAAQAEATEVDAAQAEAVQAEATEAQSQLSDAEIDKALEGMSDDELAALAKEVASDVKESAAAQQAEEEKLAEEYFAAGRIFAQGFLAETSGVTKEADARADAIQAVWAEAEREVQLAKRMAAKASAPAAQAEGALSRGWNAARGAAAKGLKYVKGHPVAAGAAAAGVGGLAALIAASKLKGGEKAAEAAPSVSAIEKFAALLDKELKG